MCKEDLHFEGRVAWLVHTDMALQALLVPFLRCVCFSWLLAGDAKRSDLSVYFVQRL